MFITIFLISWLLLKSSYNYAPFLGGDRYQSEARMIVGGRPVAPPHKYPWQVYIPSKEGKLEWEGPCGGTLISDRHEYRETEYYIDYDFSILILETPVEFGQKVRPIDLALPKFGGDFLATKMLTVSGWGRWEWEGQTPDVLYEVDVPGITLSQCRDNYSRHQIKSSMICAGFPNGKKDACQGDSGGIFSYQFLLHYCNN